MSFQVRYSHSSTRETYETREAAEAAVRSVYKSGCAIYWENEEPDNACVYTRNGDDAPIVARIAESA